MSAKSSKPTKGHSRGLVGKLLWIVLVVVILGGAVLLAIDVSQPEPPSPPELEAVETFPDMGGQHLAPGEPVPMYNSDPPTSGPHSGTQAPCGIYRQPVPDVAYLHSMEHGAIVVQYDPGLPQEQIEELEEIGRSSEARSSSPHVPTTRLRWKSAPGPNSFSSTWWTAMS
ncbi:MAG: DUF3105 domain-containing protein [Acidimicrobiia bacterium]